ncbi:MAG: hypothetical protein AAGG01_14790, partial [Planctomycetota bacterium]
GDETIRNGFAESIADLNGIVAQQGWTMMNPDTETPVWDFVRFKVEFNIATGVSTPTAQSPLPGLDFLRIPYRF